MEDFEENNYGISYSSIDSNEIDDLFVDSSCINDNTMEVNKTGEPLQSCTRSTSSLGKHLTKHVGKISELDKEKKKLNVSVIDMLQNQQIVNNHPNNELKEIFAYLEPQANASSADSIKRYVMNDFEEECHKLMMKLQKISGKFSVMTDIWITNTNEKSFMAVILHYLDTSWKLKSILLDFINMDGLHSGLEIVNNMEECLQSMGIMSKLMIITHDNAASNIKFIQDLSNSLEQLGFHFDYRQQSIRCFAHILNLVVHSLLSVARNELNKLRELIRSIWESHLCHKKLKTTCFIYNIKVILETIALSKVNLHATTFMLASEYLTLTMTVPFYYTLIGILENTKRKVNTPCWLIQGYEDAKKKLTSYCSKMNILHFASVWQSNKINYSALSKFARDCLPISGTSIPSEQAFSIGGNMITNKRNQLNKKTV
ncbi:22197_t:CDS:2 [Cetraspora pellucida]|uniref:22197_t:CDS:1 n=1 Tax=Cetraspora pellucida TaxID=1433469 RepID=A0A9N9AYJ4_9GLOM|nr:22197_t:CDS:2 [Cetraspora pellucida]